MTAYTYIIIGAGMTADAAVRGIREVDPEGTIAIIGAENVPPYNRPPLSKGLWKGKPESAIWRGTEKLEVALHLGRRAVRVDPERKTVTDDAGASHTYRKLLIATGGTPRRLPFGGDEIIYFRTLEDYRCLRASAGPGKRFAVIGGGFIGSEIAAALRMVGSDVTLLFPGSGICHTLFPRALSDFLNGYYQEQGVELLPEHTVRGLEAQGSTWRLRIADAAGTERRIAVDKVVAGIGIVPNVELARLAGLTLDNGIVVDARLQTSNPDIYAAGDVAAYYVPLLDRRLRIEHEDNANTMGRAAGRAMAGEAIDYRHLSYFYSDLFDLGYEAVGELDPRLETIADWTEPFRQGVIYYLHERRVRGVLLWNVWGQVEAARRLIAEPGPHRPEDLLGRLPER